MKRKKKTLGNRYLEENPLFKTLQLNLRISLTKAKLFLLIHKTDPFTWTNDDVKLLGFIIEDREAQRIINKKGITFSEQRTP